MVNRKKCPNCGSIQVAFANYCSKCATALDDDQRLSLGRKELPSKDYRDTLRQATIALVVLGLIFFVLGVWIPSNRWVRNRGVALVLISDLEDYKKQHGTYPEEVDGFTENWGYTACSSSNGVLRWRYRTYNERTEFTLTCFHRGPAIFSEEVWEGYSSKTKEWRTISDYDEGSEMGETGR